MIWLRIMSDPQIAQATVNDLKKALNEHENMILLDVRSVGEFVRGRIAGSVNLPLQDVSDGVEQVIPNKNQKVYVYCLSGSRSAMAVEEMMEKGYTNVFNVISGLLAWRAKKYPLVT